jgi:hypothetical protein
MLADKAIPMPVSGDLFDEVSMKLLETHMRNLLRRS